MTRKEVSVLHENYIAALFTGERSASSGASSYRKGDVGVQSSRTSFECKATGGPPSSIKRSTIVSQMEKIADEALTENREPALALRYFDPDSPLAGYDGWIDLVVRLAIHDAERERRVYGAQD